MTTAASATMGLGPVGCGTRLHPAESALAAGSCTWTTGASAGGAFSLTYNLKGVFAPRLRDVKYVPDYGLGADAMKEVSVSTFTRFCVSSPATRERTVLAFAGLLKDSSGFNPNGALVGLFRRTHWETGEIDILVDAQPNLNPMAKQYESRKTRFEELKQAYIELWRSRDASFFKVEPIGVSVGELIVRVDPEVGMRTVDGERALKLWLNAKEMPQRLSHVYHYLFGEASKDTDWPVERHLGIWDVPRLALPLPPRLPDTIEDIVVSAASDFMDRWQRLGRCSVGCSCLAAVERARKP